MERERFLEMTENLQRLSDSGVLSSKRIFLFAHCGATMVLADELIKMGIMPTAILDNNPDKYGLNYMGIPVCKPSDAMQSEESIILIVSRFYEQMASQMRGMGFTGRIEKLTDYNSYVEYSLSPDTLIRKSERLNRGIGQLEKIKAEYLNYLVVFCPFPALGDVYLCMSYLKHFMTLNGYDKCLVCVVGNAQKQVVELFNYTDALKMTQKEMDETVQAVIYTNDSECYIVHQDRPYVVDLHRALYKKCIPLEIVYKCGIFGLPQDTEAEKPVKWEEFVFSEEMGGVKTAIISPYAKSVASLPESLWIDMVDDLISSGYQVFTNVVGEENPIEGTKAISPKISEMKSALEQAGVFIGIRSGMCDVIKTAKGRKIALYPDYYYSDTKWKAIDMYSLDWFQNIVVKDGDTWEEVKKQIKL